MTLVEKSMRPAGRGNPPAASRFAKGQSGNPRGRPRGSGKQLPYDIVLGQQVTVREDGDIRRMSAAEAFLLHITRQGLAGDGAAGRAAMAAIETARARQQVRNPPEIGMVVTVIVTPGSVNPALEPLRMAVKLDRFRDTARMALEPWLVEAALGRMVDRTLTVEEQKVVWKATRTPGKVRWPAWWAWRG